VASLGKRYAFVVTPFPEGRRRREPEQFGGILDVDRSSFERLLGIRHSLNASRFQSECKSVVEMANGGQEITPVNALSKALSLRGSKIEPRRDSPTNELVSRH